MQRVLVIVGPTCSGKSALAVELAKKFNGEVISADSRQVYKGLDIGTGKITEREMRGVRHHLLDIISPRKVLTAHEYTEMAQAKIANISQKGKLPIVVGGTGFYIDVLLGQITLPNVPPNLKLRANLERKTAAQLFVLLKKKDQRRARSIDPHNKRRLIRALEIVQALGKVPHVSGLRNHYFDTLWIGIVPPMKVLEKKITIRLSARMRQGMVAEAKRLHRKGLSFKRMSQLGLEYRALARYLQGRISRAQMIDELNRDIRRYAKRQLTYWKRNRSIRWFDVREKGKIVNSVQRFTGGR